MHLHTYTHIHTWERPHWRNGTSSPQGAGERCSFAKIWRGPGALGHGTPAPSIDPRWYHFSGLFKHVCAGECWVNRSAAIAEYDHCRESQTWLIGKKHQKARLSHRLDFQQATGSLHYQPSPWSTLKGWWFSTSWWYEQPFSLVDNCRLPSTSLIFFDSSPLHSLIKLWWLITW